METKVTLKKSTFGGFDKKSVLDYIYAVNASAKESQDKLTAQLEEVTSAREKLAESLKEMEEKMEVVQRERDNLNNELVAEKKRTGELAAMIDTLNDQIRKQDQIIAAKDQEMEEYRLKTRSLEGRQQEVERASTYVGELLLRTKTDSERVLEDAAKQAQGLIAEAGKSMEGVYLQFENFKRDMVVIQEQIRQALETVEKKFEFIGVAVSEAEEDLRNMVYPQQPLTLVEQEEARRQKEEARVGRDFFRSAVDN